MRISLGDDVADVVMSSTLKTELLEPSFYKSGLIVTTQSVRSYVYLSRR